MSFIALIVGAALGYYLRPYIDTYLDQRRDK